MIVVNCALRQKDVIDVINNIEVDGIKPFQFSNKQGIKLNFDSKLDNGKEACEIIKKNIKSQSYGKALMFNVDNI